MPVSIIHLLNRYTPAELTVSAQTVSPIDNGMLHWSEFFPRVEVGTTRIADISTVDFRPVSARRPWDALGRQLPVRIGKLRQGDMTPIEEWFGIGEQEIQRMGENTMGNEQVILAVIDASVPKRIYNSTMAVWRQVELDTFMCWVNGKVRVSDPDDKTTTPTTGTATGTEYDVDYLIDSARYPAAPATYAAATNAYDQFITTFVRPATDATGGIEGALMSRNIRDQIIQDAPYNAAVPGARPTIADVERRISDDEGYDFKFRIAEWTMDIPNAAGVYTRQRYFPQDVIAAIPIGKVVGKNANPKQYKAWDMPSISALQKLGYDENGVLVTPTTVNDGKGLKVLASLLDLPFPDEYKVFVQKGAA